jgi:hypothetical protein
VNNPYYLIANMGTTITKEEKAKAVKKESKAKAPMKKNANGEVVK